MTPKSLFTVDPELDLVLERVVDVSPDLVYAAWTDAEGMKHWFTPAPWKTPVIELDLRPGGKFRSVMEGPNGERADNTGCFLELVPGQRLVWTGLMLPGFRPANIGGDVPVFTAVLTFEKHGKGGCKYTAHVMHRDSATKKSHQDMGFEVGWGIALDQLVAYVKRKA